MAECLAEFGPCALGDLLPVHIEVQEEGLFGLMARQGAQLPCGEDLQLPHIGGERPAGSVEGDQLVERSADGLGVLRIRPSRAIHSLC